MTFVQEDDMYWPHWKDQWEGYEIVISWNAPEWMPNGQIQLNKDTVTRDALPLNWEFIHRLVSS